MGYLFTAAVIVAVVGSVIYHFRPRKDKFSHLQPPPGPTPWPVIGNITDLPPKGSPEYLHWLPHKEKYGPISSVNIMGQTMIILHDPEDARELLEQRSKNNSSRPILEFAYKIAGYGGYLTSQGYGDMYRQQRRLIHQQLGTKRLVDQYRGIQRAEAGHMIQRVLEEPQKLIQHFQNQAGAVILKITYGYSVEQSKPDPMVRLVDQMMENFSQAFMPLKWSVDAFPAMQHLPEWLPGMSFKKIGRQWTLVNQLVANIPYSFVKRNMEIPDSEPSVVSRIIDETIHGNWDKMQPRDEEAIKWAAATLYGGGADTTVSSLSSFILAMMKFPEVQRKAQQEIETIIGSDRLPQHEDRERLPYLNAIVKETYRWFPITGLGVPHTSEADAEYKGYLIPKGSILIPAVWWYLHNPERYNDPEAFDPTRFLAPRNEPDPENFCFGYGRRICPGRFVVDASLFLSIAQLLACFNIEKALDKDGRPIDPPLRGTPGTVSHPEAFPYKITPRSPAHVELIRAAGKEGYVPVGDSRKLQNVDAIERVLS